MSRAIDMATRLEPRDSIEAIFATALMVLKCFAGKPLPPKTRNPRKNVLAKQTHLPLPL
jgi:hypothetical protein